MNVEQLPVLWHAVVQSRVDPSRRVFATFARRIVVQNLIFCCEACAEHVQFANKIAKNSKNTTLLHYHFLLPKKKKGKEKKKEKKKKKGKCTHEMQHCAHICVQP
jgi:hypothetical protein